MTQPGYEVLADRYAAMFPSAYQSAIEQHAVAAFAEQIPSQGIVVDVGCGLGHVTADLARRRLDVIGCDPSSAMLAIARNTYPQLVFVETDATLAGVLDPISAIIARFSLIHIPPDELPGILTRWADRLRPQAPLLLATQSSDIPGPAIAFDHAVAPAWRWHPDELSRVLTDAGFAEEWRIVNRPNTIHRFASVHLLAHRG